MAEVSIKHIREALYTDALDESKRTEVIKTQLPTHADIIARFNNLLVSENKSNSRGQCCVCMKALHGSAASHPLWPQFTYCNSCLTRDRCVVCERRCGKTVFLTEDESAGFRKLQIGSYEHREPLHLCSNCNASGLVTKGGSGQADDAIGRVVNLIKEEPTLAINFDTTTPPLEFTHTACGCQSGSKHVPIDLVNLHYLSRPTRPFAPCKSQQQSKKPNDWTETLVFGRCEILDSFSNATQVAHAAMPAGCSEKHERFPPAVKEGKPKFPEKMLTASNYWDSFVTSAKTEQQQVPMMTHQQVPVRTAGRKACSYSMEAGLQRICLVNGLPEDVFSSTLAHELTHAYVYAKGYRFPLEVEEGFCHCVSMVYLYRQLEKYAALISELTPCIRDGKKIKNLNQQMSKFFEREMKELPEGEKKRSGSSPLSYSQLRSLPEEQQTRILARRVLLRYQLALYRLNRFLMGDTSHYQIASLLFPTMLTIGLQGCFDAVSCYF